jgi:hypothetical protein
MKTAILASLIVTSTAGLAAADGPIMDARYREGVVLGASIDGGHIGCETKNGNDCGDGVQAAGGFSVHAGAMVAPRLAILGELWGMGHTEDNITASQGLATANLRAWIVPRFWLQGGLGVARSTVSYDAGNGFMASSQSDSVPAFDAAAGVELVHDRALALDLELRTGSGFYEGDARVYNAALGIGLTWF